MSFTLKQIRYFVAAAQQGSVSGASQSLSISQSAVTEAIKELEATLGTRLFDRHPRGLNVTAEGQQFLRHATSILAEVSNATRAVADGVKRVSGPLNLGVTALTAGYVLSDILSKYRRLNPDVEISAIEDAGEYLEHLIIGGELDVAVMVTSNLRNQHALQSELFEVSAFRLWIPSDHRLARQQSITLSDVAGEQLIVLDADEMEQEAVKLLSAFGKRPRIAFRTRSRRSVRWWRRARAWRCCRTWSTAHGRWRATGSSAATSRARCRCFRSGWSGGAARRSRTPRASSSP